MQIVKANSSDTEEILDLVQEIIRDMNAHGIDQWNEIYPPPRIFVSDVKSGSLFAVKSDDKIVGIIVLTGEPDEEYEQIEWKDKHGKALIIHRIAVHPKWQRKGIGEKLMDYAEDFAKKNGYSSIRVDTHSGNPRSLRLFEKRKYERKPGEIFFPECEGPFFCFELIIE